MYIDTFGTSFVNEVSTDDGSENALGKDAFLTLLVAQMENQDPLNPMEGTEFTAQLAQYSSLEQLYNVNDNLLTINDTQGDIANFKALEFMGKEVFIDGNALFVEEGQASTGGFYLEDSAECTVRILDEDGELVNTISMGALEEGIHRIEWDGLDSNGDAVADGTYSFEVTAVDSQGDELSVDRFAVGLVDRVNLSESIPLLYVGDRAVSVSQIRDIHLPETEENE